jgi:hopanoid biosynthesis associated protein HpnK
VVASRRQRPPDDRRIIITADDFGRSSAINAAVIRAHRGGVLTSASLMVAGAAADEAVALARATPTLAVGLHIVVIGGRATLPPAQIPHLVDAAGCFAGDPFKAGIHYAFSRAARAELARELRAQFEVFAATGLPLSHVDGHAHMDLHPVVWDLLVPLAEEFGAAGIRLPRDELRLALRHVRTQRADVTSSHASANGAGVITQITWAAVFSVLSRWCTGRLRNHCLAVTDRVYGVYMTGRMTEAYVVEALGSLKVPTVELYFHPTTSPQSESLGPNLGDLTTLLSAAVRGIIEEQHLYLARYGELRAGREGDLT